MLPARELSVVSRSLRINQKSNVLRRRELWKKMAREREKENKQETMGNMWGRLYAVTFYPQVCVFIKAEMLLLLGKECVERAKAFAWLQVEKIACEGSSKYFSRYWPSG